LNSSSIFCDWGESSTNIIGFLALNLIPGINITRGQLQ
jgi:hypothetical protein